MKKYLVIGNPIDHSLSPQLHNYWIKKNKINAVYEKEKIDDKNLENVISKIRRKEINGINVTVPFKREVIRYLDKLSPEAERTQSVNTIFINNDKIVGHNTDINGFELAIKDEDFNIKDKKILILGAGGVVPSLVFALYKFKVSEIILMNRTKKKAENLKNLFEKLSIVNWGEIPDFDMIINATSIGLNNNDDIKLNFVKSENVKFFYDVIYNPKETNFLKTGKKLGNKISNGKKMFVYQAAEAFNIWHGVQPEINDEVMRLID
tara:strand:- start:9 stop:800 length:792 start_codon:yes stop_codon:yes gene_type:complete